MDGPSPEQGICRRMIHYHGTPITPISALLEIRGRHFCVSHARPDDVIRVHQIGQSIMLDNGAFSTWKRGHEPDWQAYYEWCDKWLCYPTTMGRYPGRHRRRLAVAGCAPARLAVQAPRRPGLAYGRTVAPPASPLSTNGRGCASDRPRNMPSSLVPHGRSGWMRSGMRSPSVTGISHGCTCCAACN